MIYSPELIKGTLKTIVLKLLSSNKKMYGYEITQKVKELTNDRIQITEGALYPTLHALEAEGLVTAKTEFIGKRVRKYYSLSAAGKVKSKERIKEFSNFMATMISLLDINPKTSQMYRVSDEQIDFILDDLQKNGITIESLRENLLDHICILIENNLEEGADFEKFYYSAIKSFYKKELRELEEEALFLEKNKGPHVLLTRNTFFILLFTIFIGPYILYDLLWFLNEGRASVLPFEIWASTLVFACFPLLVLFVLFTTPENLDPIIPRKSKILLGIKPFIRIVPDERRM